MRHLIKHFSIQGYIRHVRKQSKHVQHVHAFIFAGTVTTFIAAFILHTDYGFWNETYRASDYAAVPVEESFNPESPIESLGRFFGEIKTRFGSIEVVDSSFFQGKETYTKDTQ